MLVCIGLKIILEIPHGISEKQAAPTLLLRRTCLQNRQSLLFTLLFLSFGRCRQDLIILVSAHLSNYLPDLQICYVLVCFQAFLLLNVFVGRLELLLFEQLQQLALYQLLSVVFERLSILREDLQHEHVHHKPGYKAGDRHALVHD